MFDNPIFNYAGVNNPSGKIPTIISLTNTTSTDKEVNLFNAQENLVKENQSLPDGVTTNSAAIFEMSSSEIFSCYINSPLVGFQDKTEFFLRLDNGRSERYFQLETDVILATEKTLSGGYSQFPNPTLYRLPIDTPFPRVTATAEGLGALLRFVFSVEDIADLDFNRVPIFISVRNTINGCVDQFPLVQTQAGSSASSPNNATYQEVLQSTNFAPFGVESILLQSPKIQELAKNPIFVTERDANGNRNEQQVFLQRTPYTRPNQRIMRNIKEIDGATEVRLTLPKNTNADLYIYEKNRLIG